MLNPCAFALENNRTTLVLYFVVMLVGVVTYLTIGRSEYPAFTIRNAMVITSYDGRSAMQVEEEVTEPLEQAIRQLAEIDTVTSTSKPGVSIISVEIKEDYFEMEDIWSDMRNKIIETRLPDGAGVPAVNDSFGDVFPYIYAIKGDGFTAKELYDRAKHVRDRLLELDGVAKVALHGVQQERIYLEFSSTELAARGISPADISNGLRSQNAIVTSGASDFGTERLSIVTLGEFASVQELADYQMSIKGQSVTVRVSDLFTIVRDYEDPPRSFSHFNGERVICIAASMIDGGVVTEIGAQIEERLAEISATLPYGLEIETMFFQPEYVAASIDAVIVNLGQAFFFVVLVMLLFAGWRFAVIVSVLVPSTVLFCFALMPLMNVELEMMSIAALIIALGILVDNAVVVCEQILGRVNEGQDRRSAAIESIRGLIVPLLGASGTTVAAFGSIAMAKGGAAEFTFSLFAVVMLALLGSWLLSMTVIPMLCVYFLKPLKKDTFIGQCLTRLADPYEQLLRFVLRWPLAYPLLILLLTLVAGWGFKFIPNIFFPPNERGQFIVDFELPLGKTVIETEKQIKRLETWLLEEHKDEVKSVSSWIGNGGPRWYLSLSPESANPNYGMLNVLTTREDPAFVAALIKTVNDHGRSAFPDARVSAKALENGPPVGDPIQIRLSGEDMGTLYRLRDLVTAEIKEVQGCSDVRDDWGAWTKQVSIKPDPVRSARLGLNTSSIASAVALQYSGTVASVYHEGEDAIPIVLRARENFRNHLDRIGDIPVFGAEGGAVPLRQAANINVEFQPGSVLRRDTLRTMTIKAQVRGRFASEVLAELKPRLTALTESSDWPKNDYEIEYAGQVAESAEAQEKMAAGMPIPMAILSLILIAQFNSLRRFAIIVITLPPMLIGVVPGLLLTGSSFGFMTMLGMIALLGIIVNNAILLIDETNLQLNSGKELIGAVVDAARSRLRPILMTTATTIIGLLPLAISGGGMWTSMAWAMIFGLAFATVLTLLLCPALFALFFSRSERKRAEASAKPA
ncbi:MAG: MMPL family transporter [Verrucomicrobiaceae bacterium]|nr:MMPL family transporter [Verrucomicrobiaceae bacterium]